MKPPTMEAIRRANPVFFSKENIRAFNTVKIRKLGSFVICENEGRDCKLGYTAYVLYFATYDLELEHIGTFPTLQQAKDYAKEAQG